MTSKELNLNSPKTSSHDVIEFLHQECGLCSHCVSFVIADHDESTCASSPSNQRDDHCTVCFGLSSSSYQNECILPIIKETLLPYCQVVPQPGPDAAATEEEGTKQRSPISADQGNHLTKESPTVNLPWLIAVRAHCAIAAARWYIKNETVPSREWSIRLRTAEEVYLRIKEHLRSSLRSIILETLDTLNGDRSRSSDADRVELSKELQKEEAGYLGVHVLCLPPFLLLSGENSMTQLMPPSFEAHIQQQKQQIQQGHHRILNPRKRFRGNDPTLKQGGEPSRNLELRVRRLKCQDGDESAIEREEVERRLGADGGSNEHAVEEQKDVAVISSCSNNELHEWNMIIPWLEKNTVLQWLEKETPRPGSRNGNGNSDDLKIWLRQLHQNSSQHETKTELNSSRQCSIHAASWRRPFYIQGTYTKSRRDISQTPFYVPGLTKKSSDDKEGGADNGSTNKPPNAMVRKGVSSVEEEICPPLALIACGGISIQNNERVPKAIASGKVEGSQQQVDGEKGAVVYGMCKFHASGREDMDVRMLLPPPSIAEASAKSNVLITGRPFVCEIFDAHRMPTRRVLEHVEKAINCEEETTVTNDSSCPERKDIEMDENGWPKTLVQPNRYHGSNPNGVGISSPLTLAPASAFSGLQSETEEKVKLYGCVCWTSVPIASDEELVQKLGCSAWNEEGKEDTTQASNPCIYPLKIEQSTPLRVLHRRSSDVRTRYILSLSACRINDHWFRLRMSTSAGTYVKEFVHGDCGRSQPNVSSMLGGRTDITELDCEGIAV